MAPTEVLAEQHLASLRKDLEGLSVHDERVLGGERPLSIQLLSGRVRARDRQVILDGLADASVDIVVERTRYSPMTYVSSARGDRHRRTAPLRVEQRATLRDKGKQHSEERADPDLLVMTATPIPRTAAMVVFGDLDRSVLDEMPVGRVPIITSWAASNEKSTNVGRRCVTKSPRTAGLRDLSPRRGSERVEATSAVEERTRLALGELRGLSVGLLHGQMKGPEKEEVMAQFRAVT